MLPCVSVCLVGRLQCLVFWFISQSCLMCRLSRPGLSVSGRLDCSCLDDVVMMAVNTHLLHGFILVA